MNKIMSTEEIEDMFFDMIHAALFSTKVKDKEEHDYNVAYFNDPEKCTMDNFCAPFIGKKGLYDSDMFEEEEDEEEDEEDEDDILYEDEEDEDDILYEDEEDEDDILYEDEDEDYIDYEAEYEAEREAEYEAECKRMDEHDGLLIPRCEFEIARECFKRASEEVFTEYMDEYNKSIKEQE